MFLLLALQVQQFFDIIEQHTDNIYVPGFGTYTVSWVVTMLEPVSLAKTLKDTQRAGLLLPAHTLGRHCGCWWAG